MARGRKLKFSDIKPHATGLVFTGEQAKQIKLVDRLGTYQDAVDYAARQARIKGEPQLINLQGNNVFPFFQTTAGRLLGAPVTPFADSRLDSLVQHLLLVPQLAPQ